ncbi:MAG: HEAT repeat domain-containing protein [Planctomycetes bacterium]|nr:HEAT repeat domain-containing protein [Planctomycetota bacterium]
MRSPVLFPAVAALLALGACAGLLALLIDWNLPRSPRAPARDAQPALVREEPGASAALLDEIAARQARVERATGPEAAAEIAALVDRARSLLKSNDAAVRHGAVRSLISVSDAPTVARLLEDYAAEPRESHRRVVVGEAVARLVALGANADTAVAKYLREDPDASVRRVALDALGERRDLPALSLLVAALGDREHAVRKHADRLLRRNAGVAPPFKDDAVTREPASVRAFWERWLAGQSGAGGGRSAPSGGK